MPLYLDEHERVPGLKADALAQGHARDVEVGAGYGVTYLRYWFDEATGKVFCLVDAPSPEAAERVHREGARTGRRPARRSHRGRVIR